MKRIFYLIPVLAVLAIAAAAAADNLGGRGPNDPPPSLDLEGENAPEFIEVGGPDGGPIVCQNGKKLKVRTDKLIRPRPPLPPNASPRAGGPIANPKEDLVYRCGRGANPHLNPELVPESQDPLKKDKKQK